MRKAVCSVPLEKISSVVFPDEMSSMESYLGLDEQGKVVPVMK